MTEQNRRADDKRAPGKLQWGEGVDSTATKLTDDDITVIWQTMPGGPAGWLKSFGFLQFARAVEEEVAGRCRAQGGDTSDNIRPPAAPSAASIEGLTDERIEELGSKLSAFQDKAFCAQEKREMTFPERLRVEAQIDFARAIEREVLATQSAKQGAQPDLHDAIMNIPCKRADSEFMNAVHRMLYKNGHRDARHAAAELVAASQAAPEQAAQAQADVRDQALEEAALAMMQVPMWSNCSILISEAQATIRAMKSKRAACTDGDQS